MEYQGIIRDGFRVTFWLKPGGVEVLPNGFGRLCLCDQLLNQKL